MDKLASANTKMLSQAMFRLLPVQVLMIAVASLNGLISGWYAANYIGESAMSAVGLFGPVQILFIAAGYVMTSGASILCGKYAGRNDHNRMQSVFTVNITAAAIAGLLFGAVLFVLGNFGLTGFLTRDPVISPALNRFIRVQAVGMLPYMIVSQVPSYLIMDNKSRRAVASGIVYALCNVLFNSLFVCVMHMGETGLGLASAIGAWACLAVEADHFIRGNSSFRFSPGTADWNDLPEMIRIGFPGGATYVYQTLRGFIVNGLILAYAGANGISAFTAVNSFLLVFWSLPSAMVVVSRLMMSVSIGEEDRQTLTDVMRVMFSRFLPLQLAVSAALSLMAVPLTGLFFRDASDPVFMMTVWGFRLLPLCMPFSVIYLHFSCYYQASGRDRFVNLLAVLDGVVDVAGISAILIPFMGMISVYIANVMNGVITNILILLFAVLMNRRIPRNMEELMVIPEDFGASPDERLAVTVETKEEVAGLAEQIQKFCEERGTDGRTAYVAGLAMEEMAGNIVEHGFSKDRRRHRIDVRVVHKADRITLIIKDDCIRFDPAEMQALEEKTNDPGRIGLRLVFGMAKEVQYQNVLGLNILTIWI